MFIQKIQKGKLTTGYHIYNEPDIDKLAVMLANQLAACYPRNMCTYARMESAEGFRRMSFDDPNQTVIVIHQF